MVRFVLHARRTDNREQRAKAAMDAMANCKRAGSDNCEKKHKEKADKLSRRFPDGRPRDFGVHEGKQRSVDTSRSGVCWQRPFEGRQG